VNHHEQFLALFQMGGEPADYTLALKAEPLPWVYLISVFTAAALFSVLPYVTELRRGLKASTRYPKRAPHAGR